MKIEEEIFDSYYPIRYEGLSPDDSVLIKERLRILNKLFNQLTPEQSFVLRHRFGFGDYEEHTLQEIGKCEEFKAIHGFSLTKNRIRVIELVGLRILKRKLERMQYENKI